MSRPNNPRAFAEVVSIGVWRTPYGNGRAEADLHIDVGFFTGRLGGDELSQSPVRFRLSLKRAEIHVIRDQGKVIQIPGSGVVREPAPNKSKARTTTTQQASAKGKLAAAFKNLTPQIAVDLSGQAETQVTKRVDREEEIGEMRLAHRKLPDDSGYVFSIEPMRSGTLSGQPWDALEPRMKLRDTKADRKRGEPPELTVQIRCKREDLHIEDIVFKDGSMWSIESLTKNKKIAVEQYIKHEILSMGLPCGDLSEPFASVILADAVSVEE